MRLNRPGLYRRPNSSRGYGHGEEKHVLSGDEGPSGPDDLRDDERRNVGMGRDLLGIGKDGVLLGKPKALDPAG